RVSKSVTPAVLYTGTQASYSVVVRNAGQAASSGQYVVSDRLPTGVVLAGVPSGEGWTCTGDTGASDFTCRSDAVLAAGATSTVISVAVRVGAAAGEAGMVHNAVLVEGGGEPEPALPTAGERDAFDNRVPELPVCDPAITHNACRLPSEVVVAWPDVVVSKSADTQVFTVGEPASYTIRVRNIGERATDADYRAEGRLPARPRPGPAPAAAAPARR